MLSLHKRSPTAEREARVLLFGAGLVGGRVGVALERRGFRAEEEATEWEFPAALERQLEGIEERIAKMARNRLDIVWSAGRAGFGSREEETRSEAASFRRVLAFAARRARHGNTPTVMHLVSSAGGLYEGQRHVDADSRPRPRRPYGELKWRQERWLEECDAPLTKRIYRLSSVFGPARRGARRGLIPTLLANALAGRTTTIVGQLSTLRDYVWTEDVARHLADACERPPATSGSTDTARVEILASARPTSIHEIIHHVTRVLGRPPALGFAAQRDNSSDITFAPSALPAAFSPTDLETAIRQLHSGTVIGREFSARRN